MKASIDVTYSPDDSGYYAEVVDPLGYTLHTTEVWPDGATAKIHAREWLIDYRPLLR